MVTAQTLSSTRTSDTANGSRLLLAAAGVVTIALGAAWFFFADRSFEESVASFDESALSNAAAFFAHDVATEKRGLESSVRALSDDARIRVTLATPKIDAATIEDVLKDVCEASGAAACAVLTETGKMRGVVGMEAFRDVDLSSSAVVRHAAVSTSASAVWPFPNRMLIVALAPIRAGSELTGFLMIANDLNKEILSVIAREMSVESALVINSAVAGSSEPPNQPLLAMAPSLDVDRTTPISAGREYVGRATRIDEVATGGKVAWFVPKGHRKKELHRLGLIVVGPSVLLAVNGVLLLFCAARAGRSRR